MEKSTEKKVNGKFYTLLPLLALPFISLVFWALGGGHSGEDNAEKTVHDGLMLSLPDAVLPEDGQLTKMDFYNRAFTDSMKLQELIRSDPNYRKAVPDDGPGPSPAPFGLNSSLDSRTGYNRETEKEIERELDFIERQLNSPYPAKVPYKETPTAPPALTSPPSTSAGIDRLEEMMASMSGTGAENGEMRQLGDMLETILDIQHPERVEERHRNREPGPQGQRVILDEGPVTVSEWDRQAYDSVPSDPTEISGTGESNGFFSWSGEYRTSSRSESISAVIDRGQKVMEGSTVRLRLTSGIRIGRTPVPEGHLLYGTARLSGERLKVQIESIGFEGKIYPTRLSVHDLDGLEGIFVPGSMTRQVAKRSAAKGIDTFGLSSLDPSFSTRIASAGIEAAKDLLSKKAKRTEITLRAGHRVILVDRSQKLSY
ncbi:conjugative transposon protein TraM [Marinilongibacter aquaticus]|uniref:conjugative transposon protein TraM n=1 Tax=Marinilongibacter aquaticus TaxID=2975157 RepID=UPI0021BDE6EF|nr:conjugative transposon protein TraM [Marinilongibacter aquaticus]UBM58715.1 conjugative transposon protein TraM [Marinilongibacter aquaticus]